MTLFEKEKDKFLRFCVRNGIEPLNVEVYMSLYEEYMQKFMAVVEQQKSALLLAYLSYFDNYGKIDSTKATKNVLDIVHSNKSLYSAVMQQYSTKNRNEQDLNDILIRVSVCGKDTAVQHYLMLEEESCETARLISENFDEFFGKRAIELRDIISRIDERYTYLNATQRLNMCLNYVSENTENCDQKVFLSFLDSFESNLIKHIKTIAKHSPNSTTSLQQASHQNKVVDLQELTVTTQNICEIVSPEEFDKIIVKNFRGIIGLDEIKKELRKRVALNSVSGTKSPYNLLLTGNPGTGKSTAAKIIANVLYESGVTSSPKYYGVTAASLQGQYVGQTIPNIQKIFSENRGGVIFLDEIYSLATDTAFSQDAINELLLQLESPVNRNTVVIAAGYDDKIQSFFNSNPGLQSRFSNKIHLKDYSLSQLSMIAQAMISDCGYEIELPEIVMLEDYFSKDINKPNFGNARYVKKSIEEIVANSAMRIWEEGLREPKVIAEDIEKYYNERSELVKERKIGFH